MTQSKTARLTESAIMIALGTVLSILKLIDLPYGGSVTIAHMLPVILIAYRYGTRWGLFTGAVYGLLQMLLGIKNLFALNVAGILAVLLLDYVIAYTVMGFGGVFRRRTSQASALAWGTLLVCVLRYLCHVLSGVTVWSAWEVTPAALVFSLVYNATYMLPETIVTVTAAAYIGSVLDFRGNTVTRLQKEARTDVQTLLVGFAKLVLALAALFDVQAIFSRLQDAETGGFSFAQLSSAPWLTMALVTAIAAAVAGVCFRAAAKQELAVLSRGLWAGAAVGAVAVYLDYAATTLEKAADKAALDAPFSSVSAFFGAFSALGVKYGVPLLAAGVCAGLLVFLAVRRIRRREK